MGSKIRRSVKYFIIFLGIVIMFPTMLFLVVQVPAIQTVLINRITAHFSRRLESEISIGRIEYRFFNRLYARDILFRDRNNDTLLFASELTVGIRKIDLTGNKIGIGRVTLIKPVISLVTDSAGEMNLRWYLDHLKNKKDTTSGKGIDLHVQQVDLNHARFSLINRKDTITGTKVDFNNLQLRDLNGTFEGLHIRNDTTSFNIYNLSFKERSGLAVNRLSSSFMLSGQNILLESAFIHCDSSILNIEKLSLSADSSGSFRRFAQEVRLDIRLQKSLLHSADLQYFLNSAGELNESIWLSGRFAGTISELRGRNIELQYRKNTSLSCDFDFSGLPDFDNAFIYIGVNSFKTNPADLSGLQIPGKKKINIPEAVYSLGDISFEGSFTGFTTDFVTYGELTTSQGVISTDISLRPEKDQRYRIKGLLSGKNINLGELSHKDLFGKLSMQANVDGYAYSLKKFSGIMNGRIDSVEINQYNYRNIVLSGNFTEKTWDGSVNVADKNIKLDLLGMFNFRDTLPVFDFTLNLEHADLHNLKIDKKDTTSAISMLLTSNFRGNNIDNLDGEIRLLNSTITKQNKTIELYDFSIRTYTDKNGPVLSLRTDFVDADVWGHYNFGGTKDLISSTVESIMPSLYKPKARKTNGQINNFTFEVNFRNTEKINSFLNTGIIIADKSSVLGTIYPDSLISIEGNAPYLSIKNIQFRDFFFVAESSGSKLHAGVNTSMLTLPGNTNLSGFNIELEARPDNFTLSSDWDDTNAEVLNKGKILVSGAVAKSSSGKAYLSVAIDSSEVWARNNKWKINRSSILVDSSTIAINRLFISNNEKFYLVDGTISENPADTLYLKFRDIDISPLNNTYKQGAVKDSTRIAMNLKGFLNGSVRLTNVYKNPVLEGNVSVNNFSILGSEYGNISINSAFDYSRRVIDLTASNNLAGKKMFNAEGFYDPVDKRIQLNILADKLPIGALNPLLKSFASGIAGMVSGKLVLSGSTNNLVMNGAVFAENASMKINYLQTVYQLSDSIRFNHEGIKFNNVKFSDDDGRAATITGTVYHKNFRNYTADLTINMGNDFHVLNTLPKDNPMFYGKVYASGVTKIKTRPGLLSFDISAKTGKNTKFSIPLNSGLEVTDYSFISFIDPASEKNEARDLAEKTSLQKTPETAIDLNIDLNVTTDAVAELIFDAKVGDQMTGSGSGMLNINLMNGLFRISGDYIIEKGDYLFTLGNIINKRFDVERGGRISFNGNLDDAEIDLKAMYQKFSTSLFPVLQDPRFNERISVEPQLLLSGKLFNPIVEFEIYLPNADEETRAYLRNAISTDEEMSRQFLYLLVMKSFYSEQNSTSTTTTSTSGTSAMAVTTTEMISNQLSNWISQISNDFDLGFVYRPGSGNKEINPDELQFALSTQLLNDRVIINGNLDYSGPMGKSDQLSGSRTDQITGDFEAEVKITEKVRFKVFNRFNDTYYGKGPYTQGIGILFKKDFDKLNTVFRRKNKDMKKEDEPKISEESTVKKD